MREGVPLSNDPNGDIDMSFVVGGSVESSPMKRPKTTMVIIITATGSYLLQGVPRSIDMCLCAPPPKT